MVGRALTAVRAFCFRSSKHMPMATRLLFDGITKRFGPATALHPLHLAVEAGEIFGFLGPNGAGKSTAIHVAMGLLRPSGGRGELLGQPFAQARAARARVGYVPDAPVFFAGPAIEAVLLAARLNESVGRGALRTHALDLLRQVDLPAEKGDARKFSRGMQQRLALAQALVSRPDLLILDEPTAALDPPGVALVREALDRARSEGAAVFLSSHQLQEVEQLCDRAAFLDEGRLLQTGTIRSLLEEGALAHITLRGLSRAHPFVEAHGARLRPPRSAHRADLVFAVPIAEQRGFLEHAWTAGGELVRVEREHRTLEDLFARARSEKARANGTEARP